jgi:hypothetical protein
MIDGLDHVSVETGFARSAKIFLLSPAGQRELKRLTKTGAPS